MFFFVVVVVAFLLGSFFFVCVLSPDENPDTETPVAGCVLTAHVVIRPQTNFHLLFVLEQISYLPFQN